MLAWEGRFEPVACAGKRVLLEPLRDLEPEDRLMLLVTLADGTELPFTVTSQQETPIDRTGDHDVPLTQEQLASMMGVGRSYVSRVIQSLKRRHLLETRRGGVRVRDLERLDSLSCGCNNALRRHFDQVLAGVYPTVEESSAQKKEAGSKRPGARMRA